MYSSEKGSIKQVICIRRDLKMGLGKTIAQGAHSSMLFLASRVKGEAENTQSIEISDLQLRWLVGGMKKICLAVDGLEELKMIATSALVRALEVNVLVDAGRTRFAGIPTITAVAIGPNESAQIDEVTGHLKLL